MTDYDPADLDALLREHPHFVHGLTVQGPTLKFREATPDDAAFILSLRLNPTKNGHLSPVADDIEAQRQWIATAAKDLGQMYFIIETEGRTIGTIRHYNQRGTAYTWGSWLLADGRPQGAARESAAMGYALGMELGFKAAFFDVRRPNQRCWGLLESLGAERIGETDLDFLYRMGIPATRRLIAAVGPIVVS